MSPSNQNAYNPSFLSFDQSPDPKFTHNHEAATAQKYRVKRARAKALKSFKVAFKQLDVDNDGMVALQSLEDFAVNSDFGLQVN